MYRPPPLVCLSGSLVFSGIFCVSGCYPVVPRISLCQIGPSALGWLICWGGVRTSSGLRISWSPYLKRLIPAPSSHDRRWILILCAGTINPRMHRFVARTKVMANLLLTYLHNLEYGCRHFVARQLSILFRVAVASTPGSTSAEATKGERC